MISKQCWDNNGPYGGIATRLFMKRKVLSLILLPVKATGVLQRPQPQRIVCGQRPKLLHGVRPMSTTTENSLRPTSTTAENSLLTYNYMNQCKSVNIMKTAWWQNVLHLLCTNKHLSYSNSHLFQHTFPTPCVVVYHILIILRNTKKSEYWTKSIVWLDISAATLL